MANSCFLMGAFMIIILKMTANEAFDRFKQYSSYLVPFRDASKGECFYECTVLHCLQGLEFAVKKEWYNFDTFNVKEYEHYEKVENGDLNWIIPGKFMAFMGPIDKNKQSDNKYGHSPASYVNIFNHLKVTKVVRLNEPKYDKAGFTMRGITHDDLFFVDGSTPADDIVQRFLTISESHFANNRGAIAVHCKAGLGRTGTLIGVYCMKHY